tara:strand:+ start:267 stop:461 length:195 start_codon:yes stop_codon:yes gene_type:complete
MIEFINLDARFVLMDDGAQLPITNFFDDDGDDCDAEDAVVFVAGTEAYGWLTVEMPEDREMRLH